MIQVDRNSGAGTSGGGLTVQAGGAVSGGNNYNGGNLTLASGVATGTGTSSITFQTASAGASGTADATPTTKMTILGNGNVGIGTTAPGAALTVQGSGTYVAQVNNQVPNNASYNAQISFQTNRMTVGYMAASPLTNGNAGVISTTKNLELLSSQPGTNVILGTNNLERMRVDQNGNVGIGSTSPAGNLDVAGTICLNGANCISSWPGGSWNTSGTNSYVASGNIGIGTATPAADLSLGGALNRVIQVDRNIGAGTSGGGLTVQAGGAISGGTNYNGGNLTLASGVATGTGTSSINFQTASAGASGTADATPTTKMTILGNGNVGVGTTNPSAPFQVNTATAGSLTAMVLAAPDSTATNQVYLDFRPRNGLGAGSRIAGYGQGYSSTGLYFSSMYGGQTTESMRLDITGALGIGTTNPAARLDIRYATPATYTTVSSAVLPTDTTINVVSTAGYPPQGTLLINGEVISYTVPPSATSFDFVSRGQFGTTAKSFVGGETVEIYLLAARSAAATPKMVVTGSGKVGINTATPVNSLDVNGGAAMGSYAGTMKAPGNGLIVSGNVGIGTTSPNGILHVAGATTILGAGEGATPSAATVRGANGAGTDISGADLTIQAGLGTGTGTSGSLVFQTATASGTVAGTTTANTPTTRMTITSAGNVGIGSNNPTSTLVVSGAARNAASVLNSTSTIDFATGNLQYTTASCGAYTLYNVKDGGSYTFTVKGTSSTTCSFTAYSDAGTSALTVHMPPGHTATTTNTHTMYGFLVIASDVYVSWTPGY